jgi:hypothetical protein
MFTCRAASAIVAPAGSSTAGPRWISATSSGEAPQRPAIAASMQPALPGSGSAARTLSQMAWSRSSLLEEAGTVGGSGDRSRPSM